MEKAKRLEFLLKQMLYQYGRRTITVENHILHIHYVINSLFLKYTNTEISIQELAKAFENLDYRYNVKLSEIIGNGNELSLNSTAHYFVNPDQLAQLEFILHPLSIIASRREKEVYERTIGCIKRVLTEELPASYNEGLG